MRMPHACMKAVPRYSQRGYELVQTKDTVLMMLNWGHIYRVIPLDNRPRPSSTVRMWMGPGKEPTESKGTASHRWIFDKRYLHNDVKGEFAGQKLEGSSPHHWLECRGRNRGNGDRSHSTGVRQGRLPLRQGREVAAGSTAGRLWCFLAGIRRL